MVLPSQPSTGSESVHEHFMKLKIASATIPVNKHVKAYFNPPDPDDEDSEPWVLKPEIPSTEEIMGTDCGADVNLVPNHIVGPWDSKETYLRAHYELLREDAVAPLRDAVAHVREDPHIMDSPIVSIYEKVHIVGVTFAQKGLAFRIQFSTNRAGKNIVWEYSRRLISGSIVALSPASDTFKTECAVAVVAARPLNGIKQNPPEIDIFFARPDDADFDPHKEWIMVEAKSGYYEAARHTMTALQKMNSERFPLAEHICHLNPDIDAPGYIKDSPIFEIQSAIDKSGEEGRINILDNWPKLPTGDLDATQWKALEEMLTKRFSIVQGPPGTGKTFVSVVALKILLANMRPGDPPILVTSQTNHALDQLLKRVSLFEERYVRLGGRSNDLDIRKRTLFTVRQNEPPITIQGSVLGPARKTHKNLVRPIAEILQAFCLENAEAPLPSAFFVKHGVLTEKQCASLEKGAKGWIQPGEEDVDSMSTWLGEKVERFEVNYMTENFGFVEDEVDLEYEQLKELEAQQGLEEDDYETLKGEFAFIREGFRGHDDSISEATSREYLKYHDLWKIPTKARGAVYDTLRKLAKMKMLQEFRKLVALYAHTCEDLQVGKWERDSQVLQNAKVVGMTATGLSKYRALISSIKPRIVLIEEAAEAIEAPIVAACLNSIQQMILVGDHQQLKGSCAVQDLGGDPFFLDMSMFERLVHNGIEYTTLKRQRRMAPEIRVLIEPIYGELQDHPSVLQRPKVPGMGDVRSFFFTHKWPESSDSLASKFNDMEAEMIVGFFVHLVHNGVSVKNITILTFYNGQRKKLLKLLKNHEYLQGNYVNVVTVDSYQGEENEIVILSLVRSGGRGVGFLSIENRVCVALSRAKSGFYIFGNAMTLARSDSLWWKVISMMGSARPPRLGFYLPLTCAKHGRKTFKQLPSEWENSNGGCQLECGENLECGHKCPLWCHSFSHDQVRCARVCNQKMPCDHLCKTPCSEMHICSCECPLASNKDMTQLARSEIVTHANDQDARVFGDENLRRAAVESYHQFANGGAQKQDAFLLRMAAETHMDSRMGMAGEDDIFGDLLLDDSD